MAASLPDTVIPLLFLMNGPHYLAEHTNGRFGNAVVLFVSLMACIIAIVAIPLQIFGSGG